MQAAELGFGECPGASRKPYGGLVGAVEWGFCRGKTVKILIADDDRISRRLLEKTLEREGYEVVAAGNGRAGGLRRDPRADGTALHTPRARHLTRLQARHCCGTRGRRR